MSFVPLPRIVRTTSFGLAVLYTLLFAISAVILGTLVYFTVRTSLDRQMATRIDAEVELLRQELRSEGKAALISEVQERANYFHALDYLVVDANGNRLAGTLPSMPATEGWGNISAQGVRAGDPARRFRVRSVVLDQDLRLAVGDDLGPMDDIRAAFIDALGWSLLAFALLSLSGGLLLSFGFLRRVDAITRTADAIIAGELNRRIPTKGTNDNFDRLSDTLNTMLDRIQALMDSLRHVSNDIAHALRTPLGRLQQKLELARAVAVASPKCKSAIDSAMAETEGILDTFSALLRIAQIEAGTRQAGFGEVEISALFENITDAYAAAAEDQGKAITANVAPALTVWGDRELLAEMLANLLDNAIRHTPPGTNIEVTLANGGTSLFGTVADNGPGIPLEERARVFRRLYRMEQSMRTPGHGLGLSLVAAVAELHGIELSAEDNAPGLRMAMSFGSAARPGDARVTR
jgi:signal transduction histidine kinase